VTDPAPGTIVGDISLTDLERHVCFGVVQTPEPSERVQRIVSSDPEISQAAVAETVEAIWPKAIQLERAEEAMRAQLKRWGVTGLDLLNTIGDEEWGRLFGTWQEEVATEDITEVKELFAALLEGDEIHAPEPR
jgi:hypothetical protein